MREDAVCRNSKDKITEIGSFVGRTFLQKILKVEALHRYVIHCGIFLKKFSIEVQYCYDKLHALGKPLYYSYVAFSIKLG